MTRVAVLLAAYNGKPWLKQQLESILQQEDVDVHIFISVDISSDGTEDFIDKFADSDNRISILPHGEKLGGAAANFFRLISYIRLEDFDYISFSDQDDIWLPDKLSRGCKKLTEIKFDGYSSNVTALWPSGRQLLVKKSQPQKKWDFLFEGGGAGCTYILTMNLSRALKSFLCENQEVMKKVWMHDWFIYSFARAKGFKWYIDDFASLMYRQHYDNEVGVNTGWYAKLYRVKKIIGGLGFQQSVLFASILGLESKPFVKKWISGRRRGLLFLAFRANQCRRRYREQLLFFMSCLAMAILGTTK